GRGSCPRAPSRAASSGGAGGSLSPTGANPPHLPIMIAGGGEQMTLRAVARLADACNLVRGDIAEVRHKLAVLRRHCDAAGRDYDTIEKTHVQRWLLSRTAAALAAKHERLGRRGSAPRCAW